MTETEEHLRLLSIFHYVVGGFTALLSCLPVFHMIMGGLILFAETDSGEPIPAIIGILLMLIPALFILAGWTFSACIILAGRKLQAHRSHTFCTVIAAIECVMFPFGTALGVFSLIVLTKPGTKELFSKAGQNR
jgi:hypothetical protein